MFNLIATAADAAAQPKPNPIMQMLPIILIFVVFMFFMSRSQKKQQLKRQQMIDQITKGTEVLLTSGIFGKVVEVAEQEMIIEVNIINTT